MRSSSSFSALAPAVALALLAALAVVLAPEADAGAVTCAGHRATIVGTANSEVLSGTNGPDVIAGLGGSDTISARGGNDIVCGGSGADRITGSVGNDRIYGGLDRLIRTEEGTTERTGDTLRGGSGNDRLVGGLDTRVADDVFPDTLLWDTATGPVTIRLGTGVATGQGTDSFIATAVAVVGSNFNDLIDGSSSSDRINGGRGSDRIYGHGGNDRIVADGTTAGTSANADLVRGGYGNDQISATFGTDQLYGGPGNDVIDDLAAGPDRIDAGGGRDLVVYDIADTTRTQTLIGGDGFDELSLFANQVNPTGGAALGSWHMGLGQLLFAVDHPIAVQATGFEKGDLSTFGATWTVRGTPNADSISAGSIASIHFVALGGNDTLLGSSGDDTFSGGPGTDHSLAMGAGDDTCLSVEVIDGNDCEHVTP